MEEGEEVKYETIPDDEFLIRKIHDMTLNKLDENFILQNCHDHALFKLELYFFADLCYQMNFDCSCTDFTQATFSNLLKLLINKRSLLSQEIKAGIARIINTILRNNHGDFL